MAERKPISKKLRFEVFKRDGFTCQYCGSAPPSVILHIDHIKPVVDGGKNCIDNLVTSCDACNLGKGPRSLDAIPQSLKDKAADIAEREAQIKGYYAVIEAKRSRLEDEAWDIVEALEGEPTSSYSKQFLTSIKMFLGKLAYHDLLDAADQANARIPSNRTKRFKYFCGICWNMIKRVENGAR